MTMMSETPTVSLLGRKSVQRKKVKFNRMYEPNHSHFPNENETTEIIHEIIPENEPTTTLSLNNSRPTIHWGPVEDEDFIGKEQINTDVDHFEALFARSNASLAPSDHPRCYSTSSPSGTSACLTVDASSHLCATSQPLLSSSNSSKAKQSNDMNRRQSLSSSSSIKNQRSNSVSARIKRQNFSSAHASPAFLQPSNIPTEQLEPLARSCSYKRPQSIKKYRRQKEKEREHQQHFSTGKQNGATITTSQNNYPLQTNISDSSRKPTTNATVRISASELMATDDQLSSGLNTQRTGRIGSLPLDQLPLPDEGDQEIYLVRQFHTTSKGFVNRGDSFKRSFKRSGSITHRNSFRNQQNATVTERRSSQENDSNHPSLSRKETRISTKSLTNTSGINLNGVLDSHYVDNNLSSTMPLHAQDANNGEPLVEHIQTADGRIQKIHVYQVYLLGMSGTGKYSLLRQFKTTEYRGIYDYSGSIEDDPDNTVSIMLDGIESRLHIITMDIDHIKSNNLVGDAYIIVYSITDRHSFHNAIQLIKTIRDNEIINNKSSLRNDVPIILVGNKSDLVRKRSVTKDIARHNATKYYCKFVETSAAINDKVDDLLAGTLKQIRICQQTRAEQKRRLTIANGSIDTNDSEAPILKAAASKKKNSIPTNRNSRSMFFKLFSLFRKKPSRLPTDVENLNTGIY